MRTDEESILRAVLDIVGPRAAFEAELRDALATPLRLLDVEPAEGVKRRALWKYGVAAGGFGAATASYVLLRRHQRRDVA